jgi:fluoride exporter
MPHYLLVGLGSALGGLARFAVVLAAIATVGPTFPAGTLTVNVLGSLLIGFIAGLARFGAGSIISPEQRALLAVGFCGGFTTVSFFAWQAVFMAGAGRAALAVLYVAGSVALALGAVWAGYALAERFTRRITPDGGAS